MKLGGFDAVNRDNKWFELSSNLASPSQEIMSLLIQTYSKLLLAFEQMGNMSRSQTSSARPMNPSQQLSGPASSLPSMMSTLPKPPTFLSNVMKPPPSHFQSPLNPLSNISSIPQPVIIGSERKKPRTEAIGSDPRMITDAFAEKVNQAVKEINSKDILVVIKGLNFLTLKSFEMIDTHSFQLESHPQVLLSLASLLDVVNPIQKEIIPGNIPEVISSPWPFILPTRGNITFRVLSLRLKSYVFNFLLRYYRKLWMNLLWCHMYSTS